MSNSTSEITKEDEHEIRATDAMCINESKQSHQWYYNFKYLLVGVLFGIVFVKAEVISWFRIQEMFRLQSFHMPRFCLPNLSADA